MTDSVSEGTLRGFDISIDDVGDRMRLCRPLLSLDDPRKVFLAGGSAWPSALVPTDISEAEDLATVLPNSTKCASGHPTAWLLPVADS